MRRILVMLAVLVAMFGSLSTPASAITGNYVEDFEHPYVGLVVFYDEDGEFLHRCSGSLLTPYVFLTAGHCTDGATTARIYFQQDAGANYDPATELDPVSGYPETCAPGTLGTLCATSDELYNYGFDDFAGFPDTRDAGLIILDQPISMPEYGQLAGVGTLDRLATRRGQQDTTFTAIGYGLTKTNPVMVESYRSRLMAQTKVVNLRSSLTDGYNLQLSSAPANGRGGTCFGDSGGPVFYGGYSSNTIVGINSFVLNGNCRGTGFAYRTDTEAVINWILDTVAQSSQPQEAEAIQIVEI
jgi:hypothetical protein